MVTKFDHNLVVSENVELVNCQWSVVSGQLNKWRKSNFENLQVYQLAKKLADDIWNIVLHWEEFPKATIGKQIVRSVDGIGTNIA